MHLRYELLFDVGVANISSHSMACLFLCSKTFCHALTSVEIFFFAILQHLSPASSWFPLQLSKVPCSFRDFTSLDAWLPPHPRVSLFPEWHLYLLLIALVFACHQIPHLYSCFKCVCFVLPLGC